MTLTQLRGAFIVSVGGVDVSSHATEREAIVSAAARLGSVQYRHDYLVQVGSLGPQPARAVPLLGQLIIGAN